MTGRLRARCVLLAAGRELSPGEIVWDRAGRIVALRRARGPVADLCVLPGLVDAHTHLQLDGEIAPGAEFVPWARSVMSARAGRSREDLRAAAKAATHARLREGVTAVGEIDSTGESPGALLPTGVAGRCYQELTGYQLDAHGARALVRARAAAGSAGLAAGLSPHAPYSVSRALFRAAAAASRHLAVHCAETAEEQEFLRRGTGPFAELLRELGRLPADARPAGVGAVAWLERLGLLRAATQLVHCQELERGDVERIQRARSPIVVCPGTITWFGRDVPPVPGWLRAGLTVALGTDSRASNAEWSMRATLAGAARLWPELSPAQLFTMATSAGGRALGSPRLGSLRIGARADLLAVPARADRAADHLAAFVHGESAIHSVRVRGRAYPAVETPVEPPYSGLLDEVP